MEHIIDSIIQHLIMNSFNVLIENQHKSRYQHSCVTQLISLLLRYSMDHHQPTDVILLDFAKEFDSITQQRLLVKLRHYSITNKIPSVTGSVFGLPKDLNR